MRADQPTIDGVLYGASEVRDLVCCARMSAKDKAPDEGMAPVDTTLRVALERLDIVIAELEVLERER